MTRVLRVATRGSELARRQAALAVSGLAVTPELVVVSTSGDVNADVPIHAMGGTGVFVTAIRAALTEGSIDLASGNPRVK